MSPPDDSLSSDEQTLVRRLRAELGKYLYLTLAYHGETNQLLYVSSATKRILRSCSDEEITESHPTVTKVQRVCTEGPTEQTLPFGTHRCSLQLYDEWLLLHYQESSSGVIIGVDAASASNLRDFLTDISPVVSNVLPAQ